jgi:hypothetical protein
MANIKTNVPYDQIPHIILKHPETKSEHRDIMRALYKILKDKSKCTYSDEALSEECRIPIRTLRRRLDDLESWGFINRMGKSYARRFSLGLLFYTTAMVADSKSNTSAKSAKTSAKSDIDLGHSGRDTNTSTNTSTKENLSFSYLTHQEQAEIKHCLKNNFALSAEFKHLQPYLDKEKNEKDNN